MTLLKPADGGDQGQASGRLLLIYCPSLLPVLLLLGGGLLTGWLGARAALIGTTFVPDLATECRSSAASIIQYISPRVLRPEKNRELKPQFLVASKERKY